MPYTRKVGEPPTLSRTETPPNTRKAKVLGTPKTSDQKQQTTPKPSIARAEYSVGDKILCLHGGTIYYEAKILSESALDNGERAFLVHYQGWNSRYDEHIGFSNIPDRFKPYTTEAAAEARLAQKEATGTTSGSTKKSKGRLSNTGQDSKMSGTPSGTATSSRSSTPFESNKRRQTKDGSAGGDSGGKRSRPSTAGKDGPPPPLSALVPPSQLGLIGQSVSSALAQQAPTRKPFDTFLENFPLNFCEILRLDHENIQKNKMPVLPARLTMEEIVGDYKESLGQNDNAMHVEYGSTDSLEQTTPAFLSLCADGLMDCFDSFVRTDLLYKAEWEGHDKKFKSEKSPSGRVDVSNDLLPHKYYGIIHLIRLLSKMNTFLERLQLQRDVRHSSCANIQDFVVFLAKNIKKYFDNKEDYYQIVE